MGLVRGLLAGCCSCCCEESCELVGLEPALVPLAGGGDDVVDGGGFCPVVVEGVGGFGSCGTPGNRAANGFTGAAPGPPNAFANAAKGLFACALFCCPAWFCSPLVAGIVSVTPGAGKALFPAPAAPPIPPMPMLPISWRICTICRMLSGFVSMRRNSGLCIICRAPGMSRSMGFCWNIMSRTCGFESASSMVLANCGFCIMRMTCSGSGGGPICRGEGLV